MAEKARQSNSIDELTRIVSQSLEVKGVLGKIKANLRASVYDIIQGKDSNVHYENSKVSEIQKTKSGSFLIDLIREYFSFYELTFTRSTFNAESSSQGREEIKREGLEKKLNIQTKEEKPLLEIILDSFVQEKNIDLPVPVPSTSTIIEDIPPRTYNRRNKFKFLESDPLKSNIKQMNILGKEDESREPKHDTKKDKKKRKKEEKKKKKKNRKLKGLSPIKVKKKKKKLEDVDQPKKEVVVASKKEEEQPHTTPENEKTKSGYSFSNSDEDSGEDMKLMKMIDDIKDDDDSNDEDQDDSNDDDEGDEKDIIDGDGDKRINEEVEGGKGGDVGDISSLGGGDGDDSLLGNIPSLGGENENSLLGNIPSLGGGKSFTKVPRINLLDDDEEKKEEEEEEEEEQAKKEIENPPLEKKKVESASISEKTKNILEKDDSQFDLDGVGGDEEFEEMLELSGDDVKDEDITDKLLDGENDLSGVFENWNDDADEDLGLESDISIGDDDVGDSIDEEMELLGQDFET